MPLMGRSGFARIGGEAMSMGTGVLAAYAWSLTRSGDDLRAGSVGTTAMVIAQMLHALHARSRRSGLFGGGRLKPNPWLTLAVGGTLALHGLAVTVPGLRRVLRFTPLGLADLAAAAVAGLAPYVINEAAKGLRSREGRM
jgi:Ca2+-transporting ATPase